MLTYRYGPRYYYPIPLLDAQRAIRYVRTHASEDSIDPDRIGIMGFSAGGHLASTAGTHFDNGNPDTTDPIEHASSRPDFMVLVAYPVISMEPGITHNGSLHHLLGEEPNPMLENELSNETQVTPQCLFTFLFSTTNDETVPVMNSVLFYEALLRSGMPGVQISSRGITGPVWRRIIRQPRMPPILLQNWLHRHGWMATGGQ